MADDYQNRKDIDNLYNLIWDSDNDRTQFISREEFEEFKSHTDIIDLLGKSMDSSSYNLFAKFKNDLDETGVALGELNDSFEYLDGLLMGDDENDGFVDLLRTLQRQMYGEGEYDQDGNPYTYQYASSNSLKGLLDALHGQLGNLSEGDTKLSATLDALTSKLSAFGGNLDEFKTQLQNENPQLYADMSESMVDLVYAIASTKSDINAHQGRIRATEKLIGTEDDSASEQDGSEDNPYTVYGILNDTSQTAYSTSDKAIALTNTLYKGVGQYHNDSATPTEPATGSTIDLLNNARGRVGDLEDDVGDVSKFTEATISDALKNHKDDIVDVQGDIGNTNLFTGTDISSALQTAQGNITTTNGKIGNTNLFEGNSISIALKNGQDDIQYVYDKHQFLLKAIMDSFPVILTVETENDKTDVNYGEYEFVYVAETGKFYRWEWY